MTTPTPSPRTAAGRSGYDRRALTDDQRSLADDIASAMNEGHARTCAVWQEYPDGCSCSLLQAVADGLAGARLVEAIMESGFDPATGRGDRLRRQAFLPHLLAIEAEAAPAGGLREVAEAMYVRIMHAHEDAIREGDPHQWWHNLEREWRSLGAALDGMPALATSPSAVLPDTLTLAKALKAAYWERFPNATVKDWESDAMYIRDRIAAYSEEGA